MVRVPGVFVKHLVSNVLCCFLLFFMEAGNMHDWYLIVLRSFMGEESW